MDPIEEKKIIDEILKNRRLPYSMEFVEQDGNKYTVSNNFNSKIVYIKKGNDYFLEEELD
jgi:hypothetical protein